jgi:hypothetical protein
MYMSQRSVGTCNVTLMYMSQRFVQQTGVIIIIIIIIIIINLYTGCLQLYTCNKPCFYGIQPPLAYT